MLFPPRLRFGNKKFGPGPEFRKRAILFPQAYAENVLALAPARAMGKDWLPGGLAHQQNGGNVLRHSPRIQQQEASTWERHLIEKF